LKVKVFAPGGEIIGYLSHVPKLNLLAQEKVNAYIGKLSEFASSALMINFHYPKHIRKMVW
tara:strand:- start:435 stop:617 length:183 start_codon:yes stop_codon:yes gene_type:complete